MLGKSLFTNSSNLIGGSGKISASNIYVDKGKVYYTRKSNDNIYIDEIGKVFYSEDNKNAKIFMNSEGNVIAKEIEVDE
ncbi:hypothetical protein [Lederbergia lenta]|uniref:hypothetical protein n=1 Tax=Lederbergia lenta TaxID=1467 RepID=UPI00203C2BF2|nr:hypothetical protein [Lederbergia lenta]MCM3110022.1 hypothetical protein [Lederbergia lenta]